MQCGFRNLFCYGRSSRVSYIEAYIHVLMTLSYRRRGVAVYHHKSKRGKTESQKIPLKYHNDKVLMFLQRQKENSNNIDKVYKWQHRNYSYMYLFELIYCLVLPLFISPLNVQNWRYLYARVNLLVSLRPVLFLFQNVIVQKHSCTLSCFVQILL